MNGRNSKQWVEKFQLDISYLDHITFFNEVSIILKTVYKAVKREGIVDDPISPVKKLSTIMEERKNEREFACIK